MATGLSVPTYSEYVPQQTKTWLRSVVAKHYPGKRGGKAEENFYQNVVRYIGFLSWRAKANDVHRIPGDFQYAVPFARTEEENISKNAGVKNPRKVRMFLLDQGIISTPYDETGRNYSSRSAFPFCKRYRVHLDGFPFSG